MEQQSRTKEKEFVERPIAVTAVVFLMGAILLLPLYQKMILPHSLGYRFAFLFAGEMILLSSATMLLHRYGKNKKWMQLTLLVLLSAAVALLSSFAFLERTIAKVKPLDGKQVEITGEIQDWKVKGRGSEYMLKVSGGELPKGILCRVYSFQEVQAGRGDQVSFTAKISSELRDWEYGRGIFCYAFMDNSPVELIYDGSSFRETLMKQTDQLYHEPVRGIVKGVLFGEKDDLTPEFQNMMKDAGLTHILAVSGLHLTLLSFFVMKFFQTVGVPKRWAGFLSLFAVWGYAALAEFSHSAVRAALMATIGVVGYFFHREKDAVSAISGALILMVMVSPFCIYSISFRLSFSAVLGISLCTDPLKKQLYLVRPISFLLARVGERGEKFIKNVLTTITASMAAMIFSAPILLYHFHSLPLWSILSSVLALWAVAPLLLLALFSVMLGVLHQWLGWGLLLSGAKFISLLAGLLARWILLVSKGVSQIWNSVYHTHSIPVLMASVAVVLLFCVMVYHFDRLTPIQGKSRCQCALAGSVFCIFTVMTVEAVLGNSVLHIFMTENACILTRDGQGAVVGNVCSDYEAADIDSILRCEGVESLEAFLCNERNTDAGASIDHLLEKFPVKLAVLPQQGRYTPFIEKTLGDAKQVTPENIRLKLLGGVIIQTGEQDTLIQLPSKKQLKPDGNYDIIRYDINNQTNETFRVGGCRLSVPKEYTVGAFRTLEDEPVIKIRMQRGAFSTE